MYNQGAWKGSKYDQSRSLLLTDIAKLMRQDIKLARKVGQQVTAADPTSDSAAVAVRDPIADAPQGITFSVRVWHHSSIQLTVKNIPAEWGWTMETDEYGSEYRQGTDALRALVDELEKIHQAYNYDNSDTQSDYFDRRYYGSVSTDPSVRFPRQW